MKRRAGRPGAFMCGFCQAGNHHLHRGEFRRPRGQAPLRCTCRPCKRSSRGTGAVVVTGAAATVLAVTAWRTNAELVEAAHCLGYIRDGDVVVDPTYGLGRWWTRYRPLHLIASDLDPKKSPSGKSVDFTDTGYLPGHANVVAFDPPYKLNGQPTGNDDDYGVGERVNWRDRHDLIRAGMDECERILMPGGYLLLKCQDQVSGGKVRWQTMEFAQHGAQLGLDLADILHMVRHREQPKGRRQMHARRNYSSLLVFRKPRRRRACLTTADVIGKV